MGKEETRAALEAMVNDPDLAAAAEKGDFTDLGADDLTPAEQALLTAAAADLDDTAGFNIIFKTERLDSFPMDSDAMKLQRPKLGDALAYLKIDGIK